MSVGARVPIVATIITLILAGGGLGERKSVRIEIDRLPCVRGESIPDTQRARMLAVVGERCRHIIFRTRPANRLP